MIYFILSTKYGNSSDAHRVDELLTFSPTQIVHLYLKQTEETLCRICVWKEGEIAIIHEQ